MIEDYKQTARLAESAQKVATQLEAKRPNEARAAINKEMNALIRQMESSKADV